eukprot:2837759-Prorocentrum_lima.AAC.1
MGGKLSLNGGDSANSFGGDVEVRSGRSAFGDLSANILLSQDRTGSGGVSISGGSSSGGISGGGIAIRGGSASSSKG